MEHLLGLRNRLNILHGKGLILAQGGVLATAELLIEALGTLDQGPMLRS
jgi:hypothetical protein